MKLPSFNISFSNNNAKPKASERSPSRDWHRLLLAAIFLAVILVAASAYLFFDIQSGDFMKGPGAEAATFKPLDAKQLSDTVNFYEARKAKLASFSADPAFLVDPSSQR